MSFVSRFWIITGLAAGLAACGGQFIEPQMPTTPTLNDSGRTSCADLAQADLLCSLSEFPGQDAEFGRDSAAQHKSLVKVGGGEAGFDFTKLDAKGADLPDQTRTWLDNGTEQQGTHWSCVHDNTTGLYWEIKETLPTHPRYVLSTYSWYNTNPMQNGGGEGYANRGVCNQASCDTQSYVAAVNALKLCGFSDWRLPRVGELLSLAHHGRVDTAIEPHYFPEPIGLRHWTNSAHGNIPQLAWYVYFSDGSVSFTDKSNASYVRLVR